MLAAAVVLLSQSLTAPATTSAAEVPTTVTLTASADLTERGEFFTLTATVSPNPGGGSVALYDVGADQCLCGYPVDPETGVADGEVRLFDLGERQLQAIFVGHGGFAASESEILLHEVQLRPTTTTLQIDEPLEDGTMRLEVTVSPVPDGGTFSIHAASGEAVVDEAFADTSDGVQDYVLSAPIVGTGPYTASFSGTFHDAPSQSEPVPWTDHRMPTTTLLEVTPLEGAPYDTWEYRVEVEPDQWGPAMRGSVSLYVDGSLAPFATLPVSGNGMASTTSTITLAGTRSVHAEYNGDDDYVRSSSDGIGLTVERIPTTTTLELSSDEFHPHQAPIIATVTISPPPGTLPSDPVAGLSFVARDGEDGHFEAVQIDPETGIGQVEITRDELRSEVWTARASFAQADPVNRRFIGSQSAPVELRYIPFGPEHQLSIQPAGVYDGDPTSIFVALEPVPPGGTVSLYETTGTVGAEPTLVATQPVGNAPTEFPITLEHGMRYFTRFSGIADIPASQSALLHPDVLLPPTVSIGQQEAWQFSPTAQLDFAAGSHSVTPVTLECSLDGGPWEPNCTAPYTTPPLADGRHTFAVRATDANGREGLHVAEVAWRIDTSEPVITGIDLAPRDVSDPLVPLTVEATDQTIGLHGIPPRVFISMSPELNEVGVLRDSVQRSLGASTIDLRTIQWGGGPEPGERSVFVQVEDAFGHRTDVEELHVVYAPEGSIPFGDVDETRFETEIAWLYFEGVTTGCGVGQYCPDGQVTRGQMATFLTRAIGLPPTSQDFFSDDSSSSHHDSINRLAAAGITTGCGGGRYCPKEPVTRGQMATFLARALQLPATSTDYFTDDDWSAHHNAINRLAKAGITTGCSATRFCPTRFVTRGQMAAFLYRGFGD